MWWLRDLWWDVTDFFGKLFGKVSDFFRVAGPMLLRFATSRKSVPILAMVGTIVAAIAALFTWQTSKIATQVSEASQAFGQRVYRDQLMMGAPSISVVSGETVVSGYQENGSSSDGMQIPKYAVSVVLRNSGQRDAKRVWVEVVGQRSYLDVNAAPAPQLISLPKDVDISVRFELDRDPETDQSDSGWYVGYVYADEMPSSQVNLSASSSSSKVALAVTCSKVQMTYLTSWPKDPNKEPKVRMLSSGSPVAVVPRDSSNFIEADMIASKALTTAVANNGSCPNGQVQ
ncbi:MAG: hypothetical protein ACREPQ_06085 [Rhodanobacter sp.]